MKRLAEFPDTEKFYRGTIIVLKGINITPKGIFDSRYCMVGNVGSNFEMMDLHRSMGSCIIHNLKPNVERCFAVDKAGIKQWADQFFKSFYTEEGYKDYSSRLDDIVYIEHLEQYFDQTNRDLFL